MVRRTAVLTLFLIASTAAACATNAQMARSNAKHTMADNAKVYESISALVADTRLAVVATARSVAPDPSTPRSQPGSLVTMEVNDVIVGTAGHQIVVSELGGPPGVIVHGQVPIEVGHSYLLCLGQSAKSGQYFVLGGTTGLFSYDPQTQEVTRLDPQATWIPQSFSLANARLALGQYPAPWGTRCDPVLQLAADSTTLVGGTIESMAPYTTDPQVQSVIVDVPVAIGGSGSWPPALYSIADVGPQPGEAPLVVGHSYAMFLANGPLVDGTPTMDVVNGVEGLFAFDVNTQIVTRLDNQATQIPQTLTWSRLSSLLTPSPPAAKNPCVTPPDATTTTSPPGVYNPTTPTTIIDPNTYRPSYDTVSSLFADSGLAFVATVEPFQSDPTEGTYEAFSLNNIWIIDYSGTLARIPAFDLPQGQPGDVPLVVGQTYLIFYGTDSTDNTNCVVGGLRGIFDYNKVTGIVTRMDQNEASQIPSSLPIGQIAAQLQADVAAEGVSRTPVDVPSPPICAPAVTGM
jgi:hypothetical protein